VSRGFVVGAGSVPALPLAPAQLGFSIRKNADRTEVSAAIPS